VGGNDSPGWRSVEDGPGFVTFWGEAPGGTAQVTISYRGSTSVVPVVSQYFLAVFWGIRESDFDPDVLPQLVT
jgi:hypothetical protein